MPTCCPRCVPIELKKVLLLLLDLLLNLTSFESPSTETWNGHTASLNKLKDEQAIETPGGLGALAEQMWFMRRKTAMEYPAFLSYLGLRGDENRARIAEVFKRPTTWSDYCKYVSEDNCETPDKYAQRAPSLEGEENMYHVSDFYTGYFRATEKNNCTESPDTCTGHIVDYPCGWSSFIVQQTHHLDIALESDGRQKGSNGYTYSEMVQIWTAANVTDSHVILLWWKPEALYQQYLGTDSEFQSVSLPPPTQDCVEHRIDPQDRCGDDPDPALRIGDPLGACAEGPQSLLKVVSTALYEISIESDKPEALHSPAYDAIKNFRLSELQIGKIFEYWFQRNLDQYGLDPREATCQWFVENLDTVKSFIPRSHPRVVGDTDDVYKQPVFYAAIVFACLAIFATFGASVGIFIQRDQSAIRYAQIEFLYLLLVGLLLVSIGSLLTALPPSDKHCVAIIWLVNFGYTLELVPLIVKIAAINQLMLATEQMRRVKVRMGSLFGAVIFFCVFVVVCLAVWTIMDPPRKDEDLELTDDKTENDETIIRRVFYCNSENETWNFLGVSWQAILLLCASILAFQTRKVREDLNETKTLAMMIYSQTILVILRAITYVLEDSLDHADVAAARSIIYSIDALATMAIYFVPKFLYKEINSNVSNWQSTVEEQAPRLSVHKWQCRQPPGTQGRTVRTTGSGKMDELSDSEAQSSVGRENMSSLRHSSVEYRTNAEWESPDVDQPLDVVSEEGDSGVEFVDDEGDSGAFSNKA